MYLRYDIHYIYIYYIYNIGKIGQKGRLGSRYTQNETPLHPELSWTPLVAFLFALSAHRVWGHPGQPKSGVVYTGSCGAYGNASSC